MVKYDDVESAFFFLSMGNYSDVAAILHRQTGEVRYRSDMTGEDEIGDEDQINWDEWISVPDKRELDLGRELVFDFVEEHLPNDLGFVQEMFRRAGAYGTFKAFLEREGGQQLLQKWYDFENARTRTALLEWCRDNEIEVEE